MWRRSILAIALCLWLPASFAQASGATQVPDATVQRLVDLNVQLAELRHQLFTHQIDTDSYNKRRVILEDGIAGIWKSMDDVFVTDRFKIGDQVQKLASERLAREGLNTEGRPISAPSPSRTPAGEGGGTTAADYRKDVARAADLNRMWLALRKDYEAGKISGPAMVPKDKAYTDELARLRAKWTRVSPQKGAEFERDYTRYIAQLNAPKVSTPGYTTAQRAASQDKFDPWPGFSVGWLLAILGIGGGIYYFLTREPEGLSLPGPVSKNHGSARWSQIKQDIPSDRVAREGVFLGRSAEPSLLPNNPFYIERGAPVYTTPEHHALIVARTRTGKGTRIIVPTLLRYDGSVIAIDPKGENAAITARARRDQLGQQVHVVNPWNELPEVFDSLGFEPASFNPLDVLDRNDPNAVALAQSFAATICPASPGDTDRFWQSSAANILSAVLLWITDQPGETKTLERAREIISTSRSEFTKKYLIRMAASTAFRGAIREMVSPYLDLADTTYSGIISNLGESTKFLSDPQVKAATESSSFSMTDLVLGKTTVYLIFPPDRGKKWLRLVVSAAMHAFKRTPHTDRPGHRCMFLIDEFPALGHMEDMATDIATMSGYGVDFTLIVQGLHQLKKHYGEDAGTILGNCAYKWFCNVEDLDSAKYLSESLGQATVRTVGKSMSTGTGADGRPTTSQNVSEGEMGRSLLTPDEVLNLGRDFAVVLHPGARPLYLSTVDYWRLTEAFRLLKDRHPSLYWNPPLTPDPNPYRRETVPA